MELGQKCVDTKYNKTVVVDEIILNAMTRKGFQNRWIPLIGTTPQKVVAKKVVAEEKPKTETKETPKSSKPKKS